MDNAENRSPWLGRLWPLSGPTVVVTIVAAMVAVVVGFYAYKFAALGLSSKTDDWGTFGDYVGGVLNPIVALAALGLLAYSVHIQRTELRETRRTLRQQADHAEDMVWLSAMIAVVEYQEGRMTALREELRNAPTGLAGLVPDSQNRRRKLHEELEQATRRRDSLLRKVEGMVEQTATQELRRAARKQGLL